MDRGKDSTMAPIPSPSLPPLSSPPPSSPTLFSIASEQRTREIDTHTLLDNNEREKERTSASVSGFVLKSIITGYLSMQRAHAKQGKRAMLKERELRPLRSTSMDGSALFPSSLARIRSDQVGLLDQRLFLPLTLCLSDNRCAGLGAAEEDEAVPC